MPIYEKSTKELMHDFTAHKLKPGQVFSRKDAVRWFADHYPDIKGNTVGMHVEGMSVNSRRRLHGPSIKPEAGWDLFFKLGPSEFRLWDPEKDPAPLYKADFEAGIAKSVAETDDLAGETTDEDDLGSRKFAFERDLQNYLVQNLGLLGTRFEALRRRGRSIHWRRVSRRPALHRHSRGRHRWRLRRDRD